MNTQISLGIRPVWSESSLSAWRNLGSLATHWVHSEDRLKINITHSSAHLIWVFAGHTGHFICFALQMFNIISIFQANQQGFFIKKGPASDLSSVNTQLLTRRNSSDLHCNVIICRIHLSYVMRKPVFGRKERLGPACSATETSYSPEILDTASIGIILSRQWRTKALIRLHGCAVWSVPLLFAYDKNRFSYKVAHLVLSITWHYKPSVPFLGYRQTVQTLIRRRRTWHLIRIFTVCLQEFLFEIEPEDHWSCIAHLSAEDMLKSAVIAEKKFKHSLCAGADNPLGPKVLCQQEGSSLWSFVANLKRISSASDFIHIFSWFNKCI